VKKRFSEEQIIGFLREADKGIPVKELCRKHGFSGASFYLWRGKFGGMDVSDAKRLKALEAVWIAAHDGPQAGGGSGSSVHGQASSSAVRPASDEWLRSRRPIQVL